MGRFGRAPVPCRNPRVRRVLPDPNELDASRFVRSSNHKTVGRRSEARPVMSELANLLPKENAAEAIARTPGPDTCPPIGRDTGATDLRVTRLSMGQRVFSVNRLQAGRDGPSSRCRIVGTTRRTGQGIAGQSENARVVTR